jgi:DNA processing protein
MNDLLYQIAITQIPGVGDITAKQLIAYCGGAKEVFEEKKSALEKIPSIGSITAKSIIEQNVLMRAEKEVLFIEKNNITPLFYLNDNYPTKLKYCPDSPIMLYLNGNSDFNNQKIVSIVGTRNMTDYGKKLTEQLVADLIQHNVIVLSGLAYGIDITAHKAALQNNLKTYAVVAHGLDAVYPGTHANTLQKMIDNGGGCITEFLSQSNPDKENFPKRNRIVAGMSDCVVVVEAGKKGGALITADLANGYNRDVFAFPGNVGETYSEGCNNIIKMNKAALLQSAKDIEYIMGWEKQSEKPKAIQKNLFVELTDTEQKIVSIISEQKAIDIDSLCAKAELSMSKISGMLLNLEFSGVIKQLPGKRFELN